MSQRIAKVAGALTRSMRQAAAGLGGSDDAIEVDAWNREKN
jgi:hypothetical protein